MRLLGFRVEKLWVILWFFQSSGFSLLYCISNYHECCYINTFNNLLLGWQYKSDSVFSYHVLRLYVIRFSYQIQLSDSVVRFSLYNAGILSVFRRVVVHVLMTVN